MTMNLCVRVPVGIVIGKDTVEVDWTQLPNAWILVFVS